MASLARRRSENAAGDLFVDDTCIDCGTCRWMAPATFTREGPMSAVTTQPQDAGQRRLALRALVACPTASIGTAPPAPDVKEAAADFPIEVAPGVFHLGYHSPDSFGAASYLVRTAAGNVMVDSPRFAAPLARAIDTMGGLALMAFTHRDDVADQAKWHDRFGCDRVIHADDARAVPGAERTITGRDPVDVVPGLTAIPVPGHTRGHMVFHHAASGALLTGDHVAWSPTRGHLIAFRGANWYDWGETIASMERLRAWSFEHVLPGHGHPVSLPVDEMQASLERCITWMRTVA